MNGAAPSVRNYAGHWILFLFAAAGLFLFFKVDLPFTGRSAPPSHPARDLTPAALTKDWFFIVKVPEATQGFGSPDSAPRQFEEWLIALIKKGYNPIRLSEVLERLHTGRPLPNRSVVIAFDPGYRQTHEKFSPILERHNIPALWVTDKKAIRKADTRYLSWHHLNKLERSDRWDVALTDSSGYFTFLTKDGEKEAGKWIFDATNTAFNSGVDSPHLNRLNANAEWTTEDLTHRLETEVPAEGPAHLGVERIQDHPWGIAHPPSSNAAAAFDLTADPLKRFETVSWRSTAGHQNYALKIDAERVDGELWVFLKFRPDDDQRLAVGFTPDGCAVEDQQKGNGLLLARSSRFQLEPGPFQAEIRMQDQTLRIFAGGEEQMTVNGIANNPNTSGHIGLMVYDKVRGAAQVKSASLQFLPAGETPL